MKHFSLIALLLVLLAVPGCWCCKKKECKPKPCTSRSVDVEPVAWYDIDIDEDDTFYLAENMQDDQDENEIILK